MGTNMYADAMGDAYQRLQGLGYERGERDYANHGPMAAESLCTMGFGDYIPAWVERYTRRAAHHDPPEPRLSIDATDEASWRGAMGEFQRVGDWEQLFGRELAEQSWQDVLVHWWPRLLPGLLAGLTHGLIRTAHAVRCLSATSQPHDLALQEFSRGLAYWAARYRPLPGTVALIGECSVSEAVARLPRPGPDQPPDPGGRMSILAHAPGYDEALSSLNTVAPAHRLSEMTTTFAGVYLRHPEVAPVPLIHGVTAPSAMRMVLGHLPAQLHVGSVAAMWQVHVALLLMFTSGPRDEQDALQYASHVTLPTWVDLFERAVASGDEHAIKFTEACYRENLLQPDPRFPCAVAAALQRMGSSSSALL
ncbi:questin oxidase family protein [Mycobacterium sp. OTB74]|uniref:questin oxidase family protein n=1 Tax=Mycobacterium sp. OTB74 TaxID=1853452 RepID=UPI002476EA4A|nr:questin oxidase family protein [Mycobacterium sp. OTB74]MDH6247381.1 hypothetical protein [Mycobacterium sp. OTB74]